MPCCSTGALIVTIIAVQLATRVEMRVTACGAYSRAAPVPKMPAGLVELVEGLTKDVLKNNPANIYDFCANHLEKLLEIRDGQSPKNKSLEERISKAQEKVRQRAKERQQRYDKEMQNYKRHDGPENVDLGKETQNLRYQETIPNLKAPVYQDQKLSLSSEVEVSHELSNNSLTSKDFDDSDKIPLSKSSTVSSVSKITVVDLGNDQDSSNKVDFEDEIESDNTAKVDDQRVITIVDGEVQDSIESPFTTSDNQEVVAEKPIIETDILEHKDVSVESTTFYQMETPNDTNELVLDNVTLKSPDAIINNINRRDDEKENKDDYFVKKNVDAEVISDKNNFTVTTPENNDNGINTFSKNFDENNLVTDTKQIAESVDDIQENRNNYSSTVVITDDTKSLVDNIKDIASDNNMVTDIDKDSDSKKGSIQTKAKIDIEPLNHSPSQEYVQVSTFPDETNLSIDFNDQIITKRTEIAIIPTTTDDKKNIELIENSTANHIYSSTEKKVDLYDESSKYCKDNQDNSKNKNNFLNLDESSLKLSKKNESIHNSEEKLEFLDQKENVKEDIENTNSISIPSAENNDERIIMESDLSKADDISQNKNLQNNMDLETAAVTIQKVFRSFLFKSRNSTFEDITNGDDATELEEDNDKKEEYYAAAAAAANLAKERRPLGRMDTVLQTVNEEKSLSLSTDDSSTLSSAATTIQAHVRGFLVRNRLNSYKTVSTNSLVNSNEMDTDAEQKNKTVLNIHIVPEEGNFLSRDESFITSMDLSLDVSPPSSVNLHPLTYDLVSERRKLLKREDAIQSVSPPSNNSGKLSEDSVKEVLINENTTPNTESNEKEDDLNTNNGSSDTLVTAVNVKKSEDEERRKRSISSDESDVITPFTASPRSLVGDLENDSKLIHSGEFHDVVLPTKVSRSDTTVVRGE